MIRATHPRLSCNQTAVRPGSKHFAFRPLVSATAAALLAMAAGQASAICDAVSTSTSTSKTLSSAGCLYVENGGSIDVGGVAAVTTSAEGSETYSIVNAGKISGLIGVEAVSGVSPTTYIQNSGILSGKSYAVSRDAPSHLVDVDNDGGQLVGGIIATNLLNRNGSVVTLKSNVDLSDIANSGGAATAILSGNFTQESGATLRVAIVSTSGEGDYSYLQAATVTLAGTLDVDVKSDSGLGTGLTGFGVVRTTSAPITTQFDTVTDNSAMFNFTQRVVHGEFGSLGSWLYIDAVRVLSAEQAVQSNGNRPGRGAAAVLDSGASGLSSVLAALGQLSTSAEVSSAVSQTLPLLTGGSQIATRSALTGINGVIQARQEANRGLSSGDQFYGDKKFWMKPFGSWADQNDRNGVSGFAASTAGMAFGADATVSDTTRLGVSFAYAKVNVDGDSKVAPNSADVDVYQLIGYGSHALDSRTEVNFQAGIGQNQNNGKRSILLTGSTAKSDYDSLVATVGAGVSRSYQLSSQSSFIPSVRADYSWIKDEGYTETGAGSLNLKVKSRTTEELILAVDGKLAHVLKPGTTLSANLGVGYDVINEQASITATFAGAPGAAFVTKGLDASPWILRGGLGVATSTQSGMEISARYDLEHRSDFLNQTASVKLSWAF